VLRLDLDREEDPGRWLVAACLLAGRVDEAVALRGFRSLSAADLASPASISAAGFAPVERALSEAGAPQSERTAAKLVRACGALIERHAGSLDALAAGADGTEDLAARLARLAPGIGAATVAAFLRPLRDQWPAAGEVPLSPAARAAAVHVGLLAEGDDEEGEPGALRAALAREPAAPSLADVESALSRLGRKACLRERTDRCPLGAECPARSR
jgi:endonuclease III